MFCYWVYSGVGTWSTEINSQIFKENRGHVCGEQKCVSMHHKVRALATSTCVVSLTLCQPHLCSRVLNLMMLITHVSNKLLPLLSCARHPSPALFQSDSWWPQGSSFSPLCCVEWFFGLQLHFIEPHVGHCPAFPLSAYKRTGAERANWDQQSFLELLLAKSLKGHYS